MNKRALIALSGGVDSSVTALLMQQAGYDCVAVHMLLTSEAADSSAAAAKAIASQLQMPFYEFDLRERFYQQVIEPFMQAYAAGLTPNPCILCNRELKFGALFQIAQQLDCQFLATGHYARLAYSKDYGRWLLRQAADLAKDQSYVLYALSQAQLARVKLPLGDYHKEDVRKMAAEAGFPNAKNPDSQDICFVPGGDYAAFIERTLAARAAQFSPPGDMLDANGQVVGQHRGLIHYTIGQRKGLGAHGKPVFVQEICAQHNTVTIGDDESTLSRRSFVLRDLNWIALDAPPQEPLACSIKIGYKHRMHPGSICLQQHKGQQRLHACFDVPQRAITPGQAAVFYAGPTPPDAADAADDAAIVLGGGTIERLVCGVCP